jgi:hypothetical protein
MQTFVQFTQGLAGLITALAGLVATTVPLINLLRKILKKKTAKTNKHESKKKHESKGKPSVEIPAEVQDVEVKVGLTFSDRMFMLIGSALFLTIFGFRFVLSPNGGDYPDGKRFINVAITSHAWDALNAGSYQMAISNADLCISQFGGQARLLQEQLQSEKAVLPINPDNNEDRRKIFANGLLNDVAACFYIKGEAYQKLGQTNEAILAFSGATNLTYARVYDKDNKFFWSASDAALGKLVDIKNPAP